MRIRSTIHDLTHGHQSIRPRDAPTIRIRHLAHWLACERPEFPLRITDRHQRIGRHVGWQAEQRLQRAVSTMIRDLGHDYWTGTVYTTNRRVWEHDDRFRDLLRRTRSMAIDMETATIFAAGFANHISTGALLLVSDQPMIPEGVKTEASDQAVTANYVERHIKIGIEALKLVRRRGRSVKHLRFEDDFDAGPET